MKMYRIKDEFIQSWTDEPVTNAVVSDAEIKRLSKEWGGSAKTLMEEVEPMKRETVKTERFYLGEYYVEVMEKNDPVHGLMWDAWLGKGNYGVKEYVIGIRADQTQAFEPHIYTHDEALELIFVQIDLNIQLFEEDIAKMEEE